MKKYRLFQKLLVTVFLLFMGILSVVFYFAYTRTSGSTGLSMLKVQEIRINAYTPSTLSEK